MIWRPCKLVLLFYTLIGTYDETSSTVLVELFSSCSREDLLDRSLACLSVGSDGSASEVLCFLGLLKSLLVAFSCEVDFRAFLFLVGFFGCGLCPVDGS